MRPKLDLRMGGVGAHQHHREVVGGRVLEQHGLRPVEVAPVLLESVDGVWEELEQQRHHLGGRAQDAVVRAVVHRQLVDLGHLHTLVPGQVVWLLTLRRQLGQLVLVLRLTAADCLRNFGGTGRH